MSQEAKATSNFGSRYMGSLWSSFITLICAMAWCRGTQRPLCLILLPKASHKSCSLSDAYYGSGALALHGAKGDIKSEAVCPVAEKELGKASVDLESAYYASHVLKRAR